MREKNMREKQKMQRIFIVNNDKSMPTRGIAIKNQLKFTRNLKWYVRRMRQKLQ